MNVPYGETKVQSNVTPGVRANTDAPIEAFGGGQAAAGLASASKELGSDIQSITERAYKAANETAKIKTQNDFDTIRLHGLYGTKDKDGNFIPGVLEKISNAGPNAHAVVDEFYSANDKFASDLISQAKTDEQRAAAENIAADNRSKLDAIIQPHIYSETQRYGKEVLESSKDLAVNNSIKSYANPQLIQDNIKTLTKNMDTYAELHGVAPEKNEIEKQKVISQIHYGVVEQYFNNNQPEQAKVYYEHYKDQVGDAKIAPELSKMVKTGILAGDAQRTAVDLVNKYPYDSAAFNEAADKIHDADLRKEVKSLGEQRIKLNNQDTQAERDTNLMEGYNYVMKTGSYEKIPLSISSKFGPDEQSALKRLAGNANGITPLKSNTALFNQYDGMAPGELAKVTQPEMINILSKLSSDQGKKISDQWRNSRQGVGGDQDKLADQNRLFTNNQIVFQAVRAAQIGGIGEEDSIQNITGDKNKNAAYERVKSAVQNEITQRQTENGKKLNSDEISKITNRIVHQHVFTSTPGKYFGTNEEDKNITELSAEEQKNYRIRIADIPDSEVKKLLQMGYRSSGIPAGVTQDQAMNTYKYKVLFEKAFAAYQRGADPKQVQAIMGGE